MRWRSADLPRSFGSCMIGPSVKKNRPLRLCNTREGGRLAPAPLLYQRRPAFLVETAGE
uniref:Uncharacterized protein n=1 Tax=Siphoviridae sp. ctD2Q91 TaxID=2825383 RepID=A0A8S5PPQ6_9CAUD|nr:MAG TPA: hypothetical protein [Siphoviridae sp. ctD2Q91]